MSATAIILARAGSKGFPGKNTASVCGIPCIIWTIEHALACKTVSRVVVSSDDIGALAMAQIWGVETIERPAELAHDTARIDDAARHAYTQLGEPPGPVVILYANVPARPDDLTDRAVRLLESTGCDSVQSYTTVGKYHPWWMARIDDAGQVRPWEGDVLNHNTFRRQDLPPALVPDGGVIVCSPDALMLRRGAPEGPHAFFGVDRRGVTTGEGEVVDIDSPGDRLVAEAVLAGRRETRLTTESTESTEKEAGGRISDGAMRDLTHQVIGCAMKVHSAMGPGLLESVYEMCLADELIRSGLDVRRQVAVDIQYAGRTMPSALKLDLIVNDSLILELKSVERTLPIHEAQLLSYLRLSKKQVGLLINFNVVLLKQGIKRMVYDPHPPGRSS